jgi:hypothetical protein
VGDIWIIRNNEESNRVINGEGIVKIYKSPKDKMAGAS